MRTEASLLLLLAASLTGQTDSLPFAKGSLAELRERAKASSSALVVDFSVESLEPCRRLLATWQDADLKKWLEKHAMAARIDPEADAAGTAPLALTAYPTIVVFDKAGNELDRIIGHVDAKTLLERLAKRVHVFPTNYREREKIADDLRKKGDLDGALEHYLWLWDHGEEHNQGFHSVRATFFLSKLASFAKKHAPARLALEQRCDALRQRAISGDVEYERVSDLVHLAKALGTTEQLIEVLDKVPAEAWQRQPVAKRVITKEALEPLVKARRFADAVRLIGDPMVHLDGELDMFKNLPPMPDRMRQQLQERAIADQASVVEAFFGARDERVKAIVDRIFEKDSSLKTWLMILKAAKRADNDVACHDYAVRALQELPADDHERIREFLQRK